MLEGANEDQTVGIRILSRSIEGPLQAPEEDHHAHDGGAPGGMGGMGGMDM